MRDERSVFTFYRNAPISLLRSPSGKVGGGTMGSSCLALPQGSFYPFIIVHYNVSARHGTRITKQH